MYLFESSKISIWFGACKMRRLNQALNDESKSVECIAESNSITITMLKEAKIVIKTELYIGSFGVTNLKT